MAKTASFTLQKRNPDVLNSIANLSNDEVFTPPEFANQMLDTLEKAWSESNNGANIWEDPNVTFFDPFTKSGVFLREIVARLTVGLEKQFPDVQNRVDHILTNQVFGIAITQLTALMARRSVYCSKHANGKHSITKKFDSEEGNIYFPTTQHEWVGGKKTVETAGPDGKPITVAIDGKCKFCGAPQKSMDRGEGLETHAYSFIHTNDITSHLKGIFGEDMQFDVIIGNPPYQLDDGGYGASAAPIYNKFVDQAKELEPRFLCMVIPARWFAGGKGLDTFRDSMLNDDRIRNIEDFPDSNDVFPGTQIKGGVCYFLWDRENRGLCSVRTHHKGRTNEPLIRPLLEPDLNVFIRYNEAIPMLKKIMIHENLGSDTSISLPDTKKFMHRVSSRTPFGFRTFFQGRELPKKGDVMIYQNGGVGYVSRHEIAKNMELVDSWKVFIPAAGSGSDSFPHPILGKPFVGSPGSVCSETYIAIGPFGSELECENVTSYLATRIVRFLILLNKPSQHASRSVYDFVPLQDFSHPWTDEMLYEKYGIADDEIAFIESMIRPMELTDDEN